MQVKKNNQHISDAIPSYKGMKIVCAFDTSKTNTAMLVANTYGEILDDYEISGAGSEINVYEHCWEMRNFLKKLLDGSEVVQCGIEDIITTDTKKKNHGMEYHQSRAKITAVFDNVIFYFQDYHNINPIKIPNQSWKHDILPEEYRKRSHDKGSYDWLNSFLNRWTGRSNDVTDVVCIYWYMRKMFKVEAVYDITAVEPTSKKYNYILVPPTYKVNDLVKKFVIKNDETLEHNISTVVNKLEVNQLGVFDIEIERVPLKLIYSELLSKPAGYEYDKCTTSIKVLVQRME